MLVDCNLKFGSISQAKSGLNAKRLKVAGTTYFSVTVHEESESERSTVHQWKAL